MNDDFDIDPDKEFPLIANSSKLGGNLGMGPVNLLKLRSSLFNFVSALKVFDKMPERELREKSRDTREVSLAKLGMDPENELDRRVRVLRLGRDEREGGIGPKKLLSERSRSESWVRPEMRGERVPE